MNILVDTQLLLWAAGMPERLSPGARRLLEDTGNTLFYSAASLWEITIKNGLGRSDFSADPHLLRRGLADHGWEELSITGNHAMAVALLPALHRDPFDRILLAQATAEGFLLLTTDAVLGKYPLSVRVV